MGGGKDRDREAERDLRRLPWRHAPGPAAGELEQREHHVDREGAVEKDRAGAERQNPRRAARTASIASIETSPSA